MVLEGGRPTNDLLVVVKGSWKRRNTLSPAGWDTLVGLEGSWEPGMMVVLNGRWKRGNTPMSHTGLIGGVGGQLGTGTKVDRGERQVQSGETHLQVLNFSPEDFILPS